MFGSLKYAVSRAARKAGYSLGALVMIMIGLGFLTAAAWLYLTEIRSSLFAALVIGGVYFGLGLVLMALASIDRPVPMAHPSHTEPPAAGSMTGIITALMQGVGAGIAAGSARKAAAAPPPPPPPPPADPYAPRGGPYS
ncbi:phage holin family protein [Pseudooceanicola sp. HF7]|uniref:phage holin family protein n=1 Tax=Pseudooceanicola sp. HF7 TaxID=2721560 RepID=UPI0014310DA6|nr:phage holin family protein [Pseudooceanicola sp. HF7]NIZ07902.1 phage holin family protein [Pseudooceanicola sp. HF7]